jgi:O-antigen/teichoic acid export membrane protein
MTMKCDPPNNLDPVTRPLITGFIGKLKKDILHYAPAAFIPAGLSVASVSIFTRIFEPEAYGQYSLVVATASITTILLAGWIQQSVLRYLPRFKTSGELQQFMEKFAAILASVSMTALAILLLVYPLLKSVLAEYGRFYFPGVALVLSGFIFQVLTSVFQADLKSGPYAKYKIALAVGRLALALAFVFIVSRDVIGLIFAMAVSYLVLIGFMKWELGMWSALKAVHRALDLGFLKKFASYGFPMIGWMMGGQILAISDRFVIGAFRGASEVGIYSANYSIVSMGIGLLTSPLIMAAHPLLINTWEKGDRPSVPSMISTFSRYYLLAIVPIVFFVGVLSKDFAEVLLGEEYREGFAIIPFVLAGYMMWGLSMYGQKGFELLEKTKSMLMLVAVCAACNIILNVIFVPKFGYYAAAVTSFVSYSVYPIMVHRTSRSILPWRLPWITICRVLVSSIVATTILFIIRHYVISTFHPAIAIALSGILGLTVYVALLLLMREFKEGKKDHADS